MWGTYQENQLKHDIFPQTLQRGCCSCHTPRSGSSGARPTSGTQAVAGKASVAEYEGCLVGRAAGQRQLSLRRACADGWFHRCAAPRLSSLTRARWGDMDQPPTAHTPRTTRLVQHSCTDQQAKMMSLWRAWVNVSKIVRLYETLSHSSRLFLYYTCFSRRVFNVSAPTAWIQFYLIFFGARYLMFKFVFYSARARCFTCWFTKLK